MTTDTLPKATSRQVTIDGHTVTLTGISKGAGMIKPNMATMLGFLAIDAAVAQPVLDALVKHVADRSFNCITIDGDTSTNDSFILIASGKSSLPAITSTDSPAYAALRDAVTEVAQTLAQLIVRDGEGATKFMTVQVEGGSSVGECRQIAYAIGHSPLVKTAFYASTRTSAAFWRRSAMPASTISTSARSICIWTTCWSRLPAAATRPTVRKTASAS